MQSISNTFANPPLQSAYPSSWRQQNTAGTASGGQASPPSRTEAEKTGRQYGFQYSDSGFPEFRPYSQSPVRSGTDSVLTAKNSSGGDSDAKIDSAAQQQDLQVQAEVARLKSIEAKVRAHEAAHKSAGGTLTGPVSYTYTRGPDGRNYITGGEVPIEVSTGNTPRETISRMQQVIQAALAPSDPSPQDRAVAAQAANILQQARQEVSASTGNTEDSSADGTHKVETATKQADPNSGAYMPKTEPSGPTAAGTFQSVSLYV